MRFVIRADASLEIGTGHVMRCLTLAKGLRAARHEVEFICRDHEGNLISYIESSGFNVYVISSVNKAAGKRSSVRFTAGAGLQHAHWLGATQTEDAVACRAILNRSMPDWLVVDHYGIDQNWQNNLRGSFGRLMVIDDLADRHHGANLLLDQTFLRCESAYKKLVPVSCRILTGARYALLRPEFAAMREYSLSRRKSPKFEKLLLSMGGVDTHNVTEMVIDELNNCDLSSKTEITVVLGAASPNHDRVLKSLQGIPYRARLLSNVNHMADLMANSDFAIGASGSTTWERCCLGLPTIQITTAENQVDIAKTISESGAALIGNIDELSDLKTWINVLKARLQDMSNKSSQVTDGFGLARVLGCLQ